jgi:hypothetical protein
MLKGLWRFSDDEVQTIKDFASAGKSAISCAKKLNRNPDQIRHKACALGVSFRVPSVECRRVKLPVTLWQKLHAIAGGDAGRGFRAVSAFVAWLLERAIERGLHLEYDDAPATSPAPASATLVSLQPRLQASVSLPPLLVQMQASGPRGLKTA